MKTSYPGDSAVTFTYMKCRTCKREKRREEMAHVSIFGSQCRECAKEDTEDDCMPVFPIFPIAGDMDTCDPPIITHPDNPTFDGPSPTYDPSPETSTNDPSSFDY